MNGMIVLLFVVSGFGSRRVFLSMASALDKCIPDKMGGVSSLNEVFVHILRCFVVGYGIAAYSA